MSTLKHILYVEDDPDILAVSRMVLERVGGFTVTCCESGADALAEFEKHDFQLVLLDVMLPGLDGPSTLKAMRTIPAKSHIPVIFITAKVQKAEMDAYMKMGVLGIISKPFDAMTLADAVQKLWKQHQTANE